MPETTQTLTVSIDADGTGWNRIGAKPEDVSVTTQPSSGTASVELVDGQPEQACIKIVNAAPGTSQSVGVTVREHAPAPAEGTPVLDALVAPSGEQAAPVAEPPVSDPAPVEADAAKPGPEPTASESSGTGDQAGGAVEQAAPDAAAEAPDAPEPPEASTAPHAPAEPVQPPVSQQGVVVDGAVYRGRDDNDVLTGFFCRVIDGEHQGRYGVLTSTAEVGPDGWPVQATIRTRDDRDEYLTVPYASLRPAQAGGR